MAKAIVVDDSSEFEAFFGEKPEAEYQALRLAVTLNRLKGAVEPPDEAHTVDFHEVVDSSTNIVISLM